jgi:bifunctional DNA-binding transcriptional regulator/antitoxin component of YhaV-PrlF toxin-antitoxin module
MATKLTVTAKGQVTLKKDVLKHLGVEPGQQVSIDVLPGGRIELQAARPKGNIADLFGILKREGQPTLTIEEMNEVIADGWAGIR